MMIPKPPPKICAICDKPIVAPEPFNEGPYNVKGHVQKAFAHDHCSWMEGVKNLVRALWVHLQQKRAREAANQKVPSSG